MVRGGNRNPPRSPYGQGWKSAKGGRALKTKVANAEGGRGETFEKKGSPWSKGPNAKKGEKEKGNAARVLMRKKSEKINRKEQEWLASK